MDSLQIVLTWLVHTSGERLRCKLFTILGLGQKFGEASKALDVSLTISRHFQDRAIRESYHTAARDRARNGSENRNAEFFCRWPRDHRCALWQIERGPTNPMRDHRICRLASAGFPRHSYRHLSRS